MKDTPRPLLTEQQAAAYLQLGRATLPCWRCRGKDGPPHIRLGRAVRYRLEDLQAWIEKQSSKSGK